MNKNDFLNEFSGTKSLREAAETIMESTRLEVLGAELSQRRKERFLRSKWADSSKSTDLRYPASKTETIWAA